MPQPEYTVQEKSSSRTEHRWSLPDGTLHREDGPAYARYFDQGLEAECWVLNGEFARLDGGPTGTFYPVIHGKAKPTTRVRTEHWLIGKFHTHPGNPGNVRHRTDGPAVVSYYTGGTVASEEWFINGTRHREGGPATVEYNVETKVTKEEFFVDGSRAPMAIADFFDDGSTERETWRSGTGLHRVDGPAWSEWHPDGSRRSVEYFVDGLMSGADGPAAIEYFSMEETGGVSDLPYLEQWRTNDRLHRADGPAVTVWHPNGTVAEHQWWTDGKRRVEGGPALQRWSPEGEPTNEIMWNETTGDDAPRDYFRAANGLWSWSDEVLEVENQSFALRRWHRWSLSLDPEPDDAPFTESGWLASAAQPELESRLSYYPGGDQIVERILAWRESSIRGDDPAEVALAFVQFLRSHQEVGAWAERLDVALAGPVTVLDSRPEAGEDEWDTWDFLDPLFEKASVPTILHESIYNASGNWFEPIYWITEPLHGYDVAPWWNMWREELIAVVGPRGIRVGPRM